MRYQLDDIQTRDYHRLRQIAANGSKRVIYQAPTGSGKTVVSSHLIEQATSRGKRVLFMAPRRELVTQCAEKLRENGVNYRVEMAEHERCDESAAVTLASKDTLHSRYRRFGKHFLPPADLIIYDEAHLTAPTVETLFDQYPDSHIIGLTATPARPNGGKGLGDLYDSLMIGPTYEELIERGRLVPTRLFRPSAPDMKGAGTSAGDWNSKEREKRANTNELVGDIVHHWIKWASDRQTIVFTTGVRHSMHVAERFRAHGISAQHIDGDFTIEERDQLMHEFRTGEVQVLTNCQIATYGLDIPDIGCIVFACPTKSIVKWKQAAGRGLRAATDKDDCIVMDHANASAEHGMPDEDIPWVLDTSKKVEEVRKQRLIKCRKCGQRYAAAEPACPKCGEPKQKPVTCENCKAVYFGKPNCPECGEPAPKRKPQKVATTPGELHEVKRKEAARKDSKEDKQKHWDSCLWACINGNKKVGAAVHMYKDRYGVTPFGVGLKHMPRGKAEWQLRGRDIKTQVWDRDETPPNSDAA